MPSEKVTSTDIKIALAEKHYKDFFLTEVKSGPTQLAVPGGLKILDGLAIRKSWTAPCFTGYEIKVSRSDFLRDAKFYTYEELCNCLYIVCPKGMIDRAELPETIGLMYYDPEKKTLTTRKKAIFRKIEYTPELLLYIIYSRLESDRYPFFSDKKSYFEAYVAGKQNNKWLASQVKAKMAEENARLERELEKLTMFKLRYEEHKAIMEVLNRHQIWGFGGRNIADELEKALKNKGLSEVHSLRIDAEILARKLKMLEDAAQAADDPNGGETDE